MPESSIPYVVVILAMFATFTAAFGYISIRELVDTAREARKPAKAPAADEMRRAA